MKNKSKYIQPKLKEYDNFKKLISNFIKKKYKYVSYVIGGFEKIHDDSIRYNIPLLNHDDNCYLCKKKNKRKKDSFSSGILKGNSVQNFFSFGKNKKKENSPKKNEKKNEKENNKKNADRISNNYSNNNDRNSLNNNNNDKKDAKDKKSFFSNFFGKKKSNNNQKKEEKKEEKNDPKVPLTKYKFNKDNCKFEIDEENNNELNKSDINIKGKIFYFILH